MFDINVGEYAISGRVLHNKNAAAQAFLPHSSYQPPNTFLQTGLERFQRVCECFYACTMFGYNCNCLSGDA